VCEEEQGEEEAGRRHPAEHDARLGGSEHLGLKRMAPRSAALAIRAAQAVDVDVNVVAVTGEAGPTQQVKVLP
jgi:hypothetical protein